MIDFSQFDFIQFTDEESKQIKELNTSILLQSRRISELSEKIAELENTGNTDELEAAKRTRREILQFCAVAEKKIGKIYKAVELRYYNRFETEQDILADAKKVLAAANKDYFEQHLTDEPLFERLVASANETIKKPDYKDIPEKNKPSLEALAKAKPLYDFFTYRFYLELCVFLQAKALAWHNFSKAGLEKLIMRQAVRAYPPTPEEIAAAKAAKAAKENPQTDLLSSIDSDAFITLSAANITDIDYPVDKINNQVFSLLQEAENGQITFAFDTIMQSEKREPLITYSADFTEIDAGISKRLTNYDKRLMVAAAALFNQGEEHTTLSRIYRVMGGKGRPSSTDIQKITGSLEKMMIAQLYLDTAAEHSKYPNYDSFAYSGAFLPAEVIYGKKKGKIVEGAVHIFREPPLVAFARLRKQITTIRHELLEAPVNKTELNLALEDYLIVTISRMKNPKTKTSRKMLYKTIFENAGITTKMQKSRAKDTIKRYLDYYKEKAFIKNYTASAEGVTIIL